MAIQNGDGEFTLAHEGVRQLTGGHSACPLFTDAGSAGNNPATKRPFWRTHNNGVIMLTEERVWNLESARGMLVNTGSLAVPAHQSSTSWPAHGWMSRVGAPPPREANPLSQTRSQSCNLPRRNTSIPFLARPPLSWPAVGGTLFRF